MLDTSLMKLMHDGGWVMWILLAFSIATVAVAAQRALVLRRAAGLAAPLLAVVAKLLGSGASRQEAAARCRRAGGSVGNLLASALVRPEGDLELLEHQLEALALRELRRLSKGLAILAAAAMTAPLLGFLGTVTGMMASFGNLVEFGMTRPDMVALGIKEALTTTAAGLIVAVPAQLLHQVLRSRLTGIEAELETAANGLLDILRQPAG